jgi:beta-glucosidase
VFPDGFLWGAATAAHQVEGGNVNNNWWELEHREGTRVAEPSGDACDSYHRYREDLDIVAGVGLNTYRFSVEWSRIEPERGAWSRAELAHYRRMCEEALARGITPVVTYHHFTLPRWLAKAGGWTLGDMPSLFADFAARVTDALGDLTDWACTINEPNLVASMMAARVPAEDHGRRVAIARSFIDAHHAAREAIKKVRADIRVGMTLALPDLQTLPGGEERSAQHREETQDQFLRECAGDDFVGVQTYTRDLVDASGVTPPPEGSETTLTGWEWYPAALGATVRHAWAVTDRTPVLVTENGIATNDDERRIAYTAEALAALQSCVVDGIDVLGYLHWSLLDNFEWHHGYRPTFGLVAVDRDTFVRTVKPSARWLGNIARANAL